MSSVVKEIERKWVCCIDPKDFIRLSYDSVEIHQRYFHETNTTNSVGRVRQYIKDGFVVDSEVTLKGGFGLERSEINVPVHEAVSNNLLYTGARLISKTRYFLKLHKDDLLIELDVYMAENEGLVHIEVEFPSVESAVAFKPLTWFGKEVTELPEHTNASLQKQPYCEWEK